MADELQQTKIFLDATIDILDAGSKATQIGQSASLIFMGLFVAAGPAFLGISAIFGIVGSFLPDEKHAEILAKFAILERKLDGISNGIRNLESKINWVGIEIQYSEVVRRIKMGMEYLKYATEARNENAYIFWMKNLSDLCGSQRMNLAVRALKDGLIGKGMFQKSILDGLYSDTGGDRPKLKVMAARLVQLMTSGMMLVVIEESSKEGKEAGECFAEIYEGELREVLTSVPTEIQKCVTNFKVNLHEDLRKELNSGHNNNQSVGLFNQSVGNTTSWKRL